MRDIWRAIVNMINRAVIRRVDMSGALPLVQVQVQESETLDRVELRQDYGFDSWPKRGAEGIFFAVGASRSHGVLLGVGDRRYRFQFNAEGEVAMHDDQGQSVYLKRDGLMLNSPFKVDVAAPEVNVTANSANIDADETEITGNLTIGGNLLVEGQYDLGGTGGKKVAVDGDPIVANKVVASTTKGRAK
ncbi:phage baseplate assembly protein V [Asticcacaulis sp. YBE204]|uniref:phage baseplate assembly protein V n=1 Tax=Asticcacaulis sp. YBE204 TaxID=1282363 RepID=UPI0003C4052F|nr:phage baseplate assembly protein V [Asticcacaulis sp. YBE204]ESQ78519.1 hypothetical protein AEYBE204_13285 [Asticcacaulis sp. YBE204]